MFELFSKEVSLPTDDNTPGRQQDLDTLRGTYKYRKAPPIPDVVVSKSLPRSERPGLPWLVAVASHVVRIRFSLISSRNHFRTITEAAKSNGPLPEDFSGDRRGPSPFERVGSVSSIASSTLAIANGLDVQHARKNVQAGHDEVVNAVLAEAKQAISSLELLSGNSAAAKRFETGIPESAELRATLEYRALVGIDRMTPEERFYFDNFDSDRTFARTRVAGLNPVALRKVTMEDIRSKHWKPTDSVLSDACRFCAAKSYGEMEDDRLEHAVQEFRLFMVEYPWLEEMPNSVSSDGPRYNFIPKALFCVPRFFMCVGTLQTLLANTFPAIAAAKETIRKEYPLIPIAIWIYRKGMSPSEARLYQPNDGFAWEIAKLIVTVVDGNDHEYFQHLCKTHLFLDPVGVALVRHLHKSHPLFRLLKPHFQGTIFINNQSINVLLARNGLVDDVMMAPIQDAGPIIAKKMKKLHFNDLMLRSELKSRGVLDAEKLVYPYREDALKLWDILHEWVSSVVCTFYATDSCVETDTELQAFADEMVDPNRVAMQGFGDTAFLSGVQGAKVVSSRAYLIEMVTMIIFTASCQHAAVNFPQKQFLSYAPAWPLSCRSPTLPVPRGEGESPFATESEWSAWFPPLSLAERQYSFFQLVGGVSFHPLGRGYSKSLWKNRPTLKAAMRQFKESLASFGDEVDAREDTNDVPYTYLHPRNIPASINI